ncbi:MAG: restriction endonuclease subunit S [Polaromonas sp.]
MNSDSQTSWKSMPLEEWMAAIIDYRGKTPEKTSSGIPLITAKIVKGGRIAAPDEFIAEEAYEQWMRRGIPEPGDVVLTTEAPLGEVAQLDGRKVALAQRIITLRGKPELLDNTYLKFALQSSSIQEQLHGRASGSTVTGIKQSELRKLQLSFPSIQEQKRVAKILGSIDNKIDLNRRINQTLEAMAQAIFKSWFVDFDPVKAKVAAKQEGRDPLRAAMSAISGKPDAELDTLQIEKYDALATAAALFPDAIEASELGEIPKGWTVKSVSDIAKFAVGKIEVSALNSDNYISTENMLENRDGVSRATSLPAVATVPCFSKGQVLISNIRPYFKKIWLARFDGGRSADVLAFDAVDAHCSEFLYNLLYQDEFFEFMMRTSKGAKMPRGDKAAIAGWQFSCADRDVRKLFSEKVLPYYSYIESLNIEAQRLLALRDTLLPKLLSGELTLTDAMTEVEA